jgi:hypothetical protein
MFIAQHPNSLPRSSGAQYALTCSVYMPLLMEREGVG